MCQNADQTRTKQSTRIKLSRPPHAWVALAACLACRDVEAVEGAQTALERHHLTRGVCGLRHPAPRQILRNLQGAEHKWARVHDVSVRADSTVNRVFERIEIAARCVARWGNSEDWTSMLPFMRAQAHIRKVTFFELRVPDCEHTALR